MTCAGKLVGIQKLFGMCKPLLALLMALLLGGCQGSPEATSSPTSSPSPTVAKRTLVAFGDSLTEGLGVDPEQTYPAQLERRLQSDGLHWAVINSGSSGETSSGARSRVDWVMKLKPDAVLLEIGGNDGLRGIDPAITRENITVIVKQFQQRGVPIMLAGMKTLTNLGPDYTEPFEAVFPAVAKETSIPLIPFFLEGVGGVAELNQNDRIHPTAQGYTKIVEQIAPIVAPWLQSLDDSPSVETTPKSR